MENWKELLASFGLWLLVEDISDDGDGKGDNLQLTKDGELFVSEIQQELDKAERRGARKELEKLKLILNDCVVYINDSGEIDNGVIGSVNRTIDAELKLLEEENGKNN